MDLPHIADRAPQKMDLEPGTYWWCSCGLSKHQPFCDGTHKGTGFSPTKVEVAEAKTVWFCNCKHSANKPLCDGSHKTLPEANS